MTNSTRGSTLLNLNSGEASSSFQTHSIRENASVLLELKFYRELQNAPCVSISKRAGLTKAGLRSNA
jgi:hypothetical protein